ncbi:MAG: ATP-dependent helicase [Clostridiaceae bacterium]|nr:ATP-dependent helicase [Clostridiaceae bacterium]
MENSAIKTLNDEQLLAVKHHEGPCMVYAGPGSGKTTVITYRIWNLIQQYSVNPENILVITFTKAAAEEMKVRFQQEFDLPYGEKAKVSFGTFHSLFFKIIRRYCGYNIKDILKDREIYALIKNIIKTLGIEGYTDEEFIKDILLDISLYKSNFPQNHDFKPTSLSTIEFKRVIDCYENYKNEHKKIDFDDMLTKCYMLLIDNPTILNGIRRKFPFILIDEFQDINSIQFEIIKLIAKPLDNLFVVGDDDQSIYSFRGAKPYFILNFDEIYSNAKKIVLNKNYRSQENIVRTANNLIMNNQSRIHKKMVSVINANIDINFITPKDKVEENKKIIEIIQSLTERGYRYKDIAIVYRTNLAAAPVVDALLDNNIPYISREQIYNIYDHWIAKDIMSYLIAAFSTKNSEAIKRIINKPTRYITRKAIQQPVDESKNYITSLKLRADLMPYQIKYLERLQLQLKEVQNQNTENAIEYIRKHIGYDEYIKNYCSEKKITSEKLFEILGELQEMATQYEDPQKFIDNIHNFKEKIKESKSCKEDGDKVELLTMHSAKGLEYRVVMVISAVEGTIPHGRSGDDIQSIEEERRLFYVALTRAKELLFISSPLYKNNKKLETSRFIEEMKRDDGNNKTREKIYKFKKEFIDYVNKKIK